MEVSSVSLWNKKIRLPRALVVKGNVVELQMDNCHNRSLVCVFQSFLLCHVPEPFVEVFHPNTLQASKAVQVEASHHPGNLFFVGYRAHYKEGGHIHQDRKALGQDVPVEFHPLLRHAFNGKSGGGDGGMGGERVLTVSS